MSGLKKAWVTKQSERSTAVSFSLESAQVVPAYMQLQVHDMVFPEDAPIENRRHTIVIGGLNEDDLLEIRDVIDKYLNKQ